jgi:hypothetical protein
MDHDLITCALLPIKEKFHNKLSMEYSIKKKFIGMISQKPGLKTISLEIDGMRYYFNQVIDCIAFRDPVWHRNWVLNTLLS